MAINDNTSYELTGAQVKDLANKIKAKAADNIFVGATSAAPGSKGLVPQPQAGDEAKVLSGAGTWVNQPTVPTVNDATLTIQQNGTTVDTFTANSSADKTVNIETITAETVAPAEEVGAITASMIDWSTMPGSYSTAEQKTPFTWIDGKPIYKKTVDFGALPNNTTKTVNHNISNLGRIIKIEQSITNGSSNSRGFLYICSGNSGGIGFNLYGTNTAIAVSTPHDRSDCNAFFTLFYTKTTD